MAVAKFSFGEKPQRTMEVHWSALGFEKYVLDGRVLLKRWELSFSGERTFEVDGRQLRIVYHLSRNDYYSKVFLDDQLIVPELFPNIAENLQKARAKRWGWRSFAINLVVWMIIGFVGMYAYNYYQSQQSASRDCPKPSDTVVASNVRSCS
jgi:hypothetical protein